MANDVSTRVCPTRVDHSPALFAHQVTTGHCQKRQRALYHKCFTCAYNNDYVALHGEPTPRPNVPMPEETASIPQHPASQPQAM